MKTKILIIAAIMAVTLISCKKTEDVKNAESKTEPAIVAKQNFSVELKVVAERDDNFSLYYTEDNSINFNGDHAVWSGVKGQKESQNVILNLGDEIIPTQIRLDFGIKNRQERGDVTLENFKISYYGKTFEKRGSDFLKYFLKNDSITTDIDEVKGTIKFNKNLKNSVSPFYYPNQPLVDEISKLTK
ncbi:MAG: hypothetical protein H7199_10835 [Burkholderiales bacterium]|nr:hypothetical protein [Flavobacterium sp.]